MGKSIAILLSSFLLGIVLLIWVLRVVGLPAIKEAFLAFFGPGGFFILLLSVAVILAGAWRWRYILGRLGYKVPLTGAFRMYFVHFSVSFLAPQLIIGGEAIRSYAVREHYNIPWAKVLASVTIERILELTWIMIVILVGLLLFLQMAGLPPLNIALIFGAIFLLFSSAIVFFYVRSFRKESIIRIFLRGARKGNNLLEAEREVFNFFRPNNLFMWQALGLTVLRGAFNFARMWALILFLGKIVGPLQALAALGFFYLALLFPIPAALGTHDALQAFSFGAMGLGRGTGAAFSLILRGADLLLALVGIVILFRLGLDLFRSALFKKAERIVRR